MPLVLTAGPAVEPVSLAEAKAHMRVDGTAEDTLIGSLILTARLHVEAELGAMRDALAERLLANVMQWTPADVAEQRPKLQALAAFKYDEYQQFSPGMRFVESLALWLDFFVLHVKSTNSLPKINGKFVLS